jgi:hypothetical protein
LSYNRSRLVSVHPILQQGDFNVMYHFIASEDTAPGASHECRVRLRSFLIPTPDHYLPLRYVIGTRTPSQPVTFPVEGVDGGSMSMLSGAGGLS